MAIIRETRIDQSAANNVNALARRIMAIVGGHPKVQVELALLTAYCSVADGVQAFPEATRGARANFVINIGMRALCEAIMDVGKMTDADVAALVAQQIVAPTCQE